MEEQMNFETVSIIGLGYIGLPTAAMFASRKKKVVGIDVSSYVVDTINRGEIHIYEPDLDIAVRSAVSEGYLRASTTPESADVFVIAVPTPFSEGKKPDLKYIEAACKTIAPVLKSGNLVILESTSPVGATEKMAFWLAELRPDLTFPQDSNLPNIHVSHCPERVLPGHVMRELIENDRIIGGMTEVCAQMSVDLYKTFVTGECIVTDARTAEMAKLTENSFRDVNIAFANELSVICDKLNINVKELIQLANRHPRVSILNPGCGVGGHCIAVDPWFIVDSAPEEARLISTARNVNDEKPLWVVDKTKAAVLDVVSNTGKSVSEVVVACLGLAFKPNIDDLRESPALQIFSALTHEEFQCVAVEPNIEQLPKSLSSNELVSFEHALANADIILCLVAHNEFSNLNEQLNPEHRVIRT